MTDATHGGKGSKRRNTDAAKYNSNYDRIFCKKGTQPELTEESTVELLDAYSEGHNWRPANGGMEKPFEWRNKEYLYMYNTKTGEHAYYNSTDDVFMDEVEFN